MKRFAFILILFLCNQLWAQTAEDSLQTKRRTRTILIAGGVTYGASLYGLNQLWYKNSPQTSFHFFNDNHEWQQVDKVGHFYTAFHISRTGVELFKWAGLPKKKAYWYGALGGFLFQTPIEILDGFSAEYGASWGDVIANTAGSGMLVGQYLLWDEIRIMPKFSFSRTAYAPQRPNTLGNAYHEELLKDYNGQIYWLSFDIHRLLKEGNRFPKWLNIALGYGADGMLFAPPENNLEAQLPLARQFFLAPDIQFAHIPTKRKGLKTLFYFLDMVHLPLPAIEYNTHSGWKAHAMLGWRMTLNDE